MRITITGDLMGDVKKDVEMLKLMHASGEDSLKVAFDLDNTIVRLFEQRIRQEHRRISKKELLMKVHEDLFYGRRDNP